MTKIPISPINAAPEKRLYLSIIGDYDLKTALCELIDNSIDAWRDEDRDYDLLVEINLGFDQQIITIRDNACGVPEGNLRVLVSPGATAMADIPDPIGTFGVGSKRSVVALAQDIRITTRYGNQGTFRIEYDDEWIHDPNNWNVDAYKVNDIPEGTTHIELSRLRFAIKEDNVEELLEHFAITYAEFIKFDNVTIRVNSIEVMPKFFDTWAFPIGYNPIQISKPIITNGRVTSFEITSGLSYEEGTLTGDFGVFIYCNRRLVQRALRNSEVGFGKHLAGIEHHDMNHARIVIHLSGAPEDMPWNSKKDDISYNHPTFQSIKQDVIEVVLNCTKFSKAFKKDFDEKVKPLRDGVVKKVTIGSSDAIRPSRLPDPPRISRSGTESLVSLNRRLGLKKPWTVGLYESMAAEQLISSQRHLTLKDRLSWILLDSTVEIACKEFLVHEKPDGINPDKLRVKSVSRYNLQAEVEKLLLTGDDLWTRLRFNYVVRCDMIHEKSTNVGTPSQLEQFRVDVQKLLTEGFGIKFG